MCVCVCVCVQMKDGECNGLMCDLPFGKQYGSRADNLDLYPRALAEFARVMSPSPSAKYACVCMCMCVCVGSVMSPSPCTKYAHGMCVCVV